MVSRTGGTGWLIHVAIVWTAHCCNLHDRIHDDDQMRMNVGYGTVVFAGRVSRVLNYKIDNKQTEKKIKFSFFLKLVKMWGWVGCSWGRVLVVHGSVSLRSLRYFC